MSQRMAVIRNVHFGMGDRDKVWLQFDAYTEKTLASLQVLSVAEAVKLIETFQVRDVFMLDGKTVWVEQENGLSRFVGGTGI